MAAGSSGGTDPIGSTPAPGRMNHRHWAACAASSVCWSSVHHVRPRRVPKISLAPPGHRRRGRACSPHAPRSPHAAHGSGVSGGESRQGEVPSSGSAESFLAAVCKPAVLWPAQRAESGFLQPRVVFLQPSNSSRRSSRPRRSRASTSPAPLQLPSPAAGVPSSTGAGCPSAPEVVINAAGVN